jgi:RNA polymerase sigma-70 factor (ECF subfamily)
VNPTGEPQAPPPSGEIPRVVEHLFRHEYGKLVATLTRIFGLEHLTLAEDVVQEALARALQTWPFYGVPDNPPAWIMRASRNLALDVVRRQKVFREKEAEIIHQMEGAGPAQGGAIFSEHEIRDDRLRMIFVCCHPQIPAEAQAALALKTLCGFSVTEISRAFLTSEAAVLKRLTRAKQKIRQARISFEIPAGAELARRMDGVRHALYLLFNEGYKASGGETLVRADVCHEAIRLATLLAEHPAGDQPRTHALLALMLLSAARLPARVDESGNLLLLRDQDRTKWDRAMIARGMLHFARSAAGDEISEYHLQAAIAACHATAKDDASTDWARILAFYDRLAEADPSPVVALNRAVAIANLRGARAGLDAVAAIGESNKLESYYLYHAVLGDLEARLDNTGPAIRHFRRSLEFAMHDSERVFLARRLSDCEARRVHV